MVWYRSFIEFSACDYLAFQATLIEEMDVDIVCIGTFNKINWVKMCEFILSFLLCSIG